MLLLEKIEIFKSVECYFLPFGGTCISLVCCAFQRERRKKILFSTMENKNVLFLKAH
jgi:hypothetical protein